MSLSLLLAGLVVLITHTLEAITGFGCTVLGIPFVSALLGVKTAVKTMTVLAWLLALYFVVTKFKYIDFKQYGIIAFFMLLGMPIGMYLFRAQQNDSLFMFLAWFIVVVSVVQLVRISTQTGEPPLLKGKAVIPYYILLFIGGIVHGVFSSGGPLVVLYASRTLRDKSTFRSTLCLLWTTLNTIIISTYLIEGSFKADVAKTTGIMIPFVLLGIYLGEKVHNKVDSKRFSLLVFAMLLATGIFMLVF
ncbi:sulfite exporter TauE/SafE family protein [Sphaerochaeta sp.]|uniref:sulfite exporter TauE/SafE family protein n=1 Tax=Sphaerochaeta sp. TaxID=1972642 RepID=UPI002FC5903E